MSAEALGRVLVSEVDYPPLKRLPVHAHATPYLSFVLAGRYVEAIGSHRLECRRYTLRFHPAGEEHADTFGPGRATCLNVELLGDWDETIAELQLNASEPVLTDGALSHAFRVRYDNRYPDASSALCFEESTLELLALCARQARVLRVARESRAIARAVEYVEEQLDAKAPMSFRAITAAAGVHATHLARLFRTQLSSTVGGYVRARRLARAQREVIARPERSLSRIAAEYGFADHAHFTRCFNTTFRITPSALRRAARVVEQHTRDS